MSSSPVKIGVLMFVAASLFFFSFPLLAKMEKRQKTNKVVSSESGLNMPDWGIAIDAVYDNRLDNLVPGYKILNVVLTNRGRNAVYLDASRDKWFIRDSIGKKREALTHLRSRDEKLWSSLPQGLQEKLEYPNLVRVGHSTKIDLFFEKGVELAHFREINWDSAYFKKEFNILNSVEKNLELEPNQDPIPKESPTYRQSMEKYEGTTDLKPEEKTETPPAEEESRPIRESVTIPMD